MSETVYIYCYFMLYIRMISLLIVISDATCQCNKTHNKVFMATEKIVTTKPRRTIRHLMQKKLKITRHCKLKTTGKGVE